ncbi:MAG: DEAD/DEAH box helicase family protein, partial [Acidobacteria bacterium]|nr:DEAD/DEAH box helicase family protein [Acidobacteriota bacterium]
LKMATGTGKTNLMAMLALWWAARSRAEVDFLAIAPNLTVRDRLTALDPRNEDPLWDSITPRDFERYRRRMRWSILNFQKFQRRTGPDGLDEAGGKEKRFLRAGTPEPPGWTETPPAMLDRLLRAHRRGARFVVFNDEAHHCYAPVDIKGKVDAEEREDRQAAALWFSALEALHDENRLEQVFDLSATPMWLRRPADLTSEIFPWTVSDFPLLDAIESGLTKVPRVPVADDRSAEQPKYRNVYVFADGKDLPQGGPQGKVREPLAELYEHYETRVEPVFRERGILPIFIVVANKIANAERLHRWIAGASREHGLGTPGNLPLLSNYQPDGTPKPHPPTVLVHSKLGDPEGLTGKAAAAIEEQAALHAPDAGTKAEKQDAIRRIFTTAGRKGEPGEYIRCVVSVGMLTEGWDARNVTHIFGYRRFGSLLLCEQVTGRALRRTAFSGKDEAQAPEYANVFGVPYSFARSDDDPVPVVPIQPWRVYSITGRAGYRIAFPNVVGYAPPETVTRWSLNPAKVAGGRVAGRPTPGVTDEAGPAGDEQRILREYREETDLWQASAKVAAHLDPQRSQRRAAFIDALTAVREFLRLPQVVCPDPSGLQYDEKAVGDIAAACEARRPPTPWRPVFADERDRGLPRLRDTADVDFETTLPHRHDAARSELNAAACHSLPERELAGILDRHPDVAAWARNFRLGWVVPWFDPELDLWRRTEPDFVARAVPEPGKRPLHLVIEFKGLRAGEASEEAKRVWLGRWCDAVSVCREADQDYGQWKVVWIESLLDAAEQISATTDRREDT